MRQVGPPSVSRNEGSFSAFVICAGIHLNDGLSSQGYLMLLDLLEPF